MNSKQLRVMWFGIVLAILALLFTPRWDWDSAVYHYRFITDAQGQIQGRIIWMELGIIALLAAGGILTLRTGRGHDIPNRPDQPVRRVRWLRAMVLAGVIAVGGAVGMYLKSRAGSAREEQAQRAAIGQLVVDAAEWQSYAPQTLLVRLYNPTNTSINERDVIFHLRVHDPTLNTDFDRRYRRTIWLRAQEVLTVNVELGQPFDTTLRPIVTLESPGSPRSVAGTEPTAEFRGDIFDQVAAEQLLKKIRAKYPEYRDLSDREFGTRLYRKYPQAYPELKWYAAGAASYSNRISPWPGYRAEYAGTHDYTFTVDGHHNDLVWNRGRTPSQRDGENLARLYTHGLRAFMPHQVRKDALAGGKNPLEGATRRGP